MVIKIFTTGGTIDGIKNNGKYHFDGTHINDLLKRGRNLQNVDIEPIFQMESIDMKDEHREIIYKKCLDCKNTEIIITHGTVSMVETGKYLGERIKNKVIVLVGAAIPFNEEKSDALFNLGFAMASVQILKKGVYIAMNGKIFDFNNVKKNFEKRIFETLD